MSDKFYPPSTLQTIQELKDWRDDAAVELYKEAGGGKLVGALMKLHRALDKQSAKLEEFHNTPYSKDHAKLIETTVNTISFVELQLERWHYLIYPNQRPNA